MRSSIDHIQVLVIEDNPVDQEVLRRELRNTSFNDHILFLAEPLKALAKLQAPDDTLKSNLLAVFLDINLPGISGLEFLAIMRSITGLETLPVIVMTGFPSPDVIAKCQRITSPCSGGKAGAFVKIRHRTCGDFSFSARGSQCKFLRQERPCYYCETLSFENGLGVSIGKRASRPCCYGQDVRIHSRLTDQAN